MASGSRFAPLLDLSDTELSDSESSADTDPEFSEMMDMLFVRVEDLIDSENVSEEQLRYEQEMLDDLRNRSIEDGTLMPIHIWRDGEISFLRLLRSRQQFPVKSEGNSDFSEEEGEAECMENTGMSEVEEDNQNETSEVEEDSLHDVMERIFECISNSLPSNALPSENIPENQLRNSFFTKTKFKTSKKRT